MMVDDVHVDDVMLKSNNNHDKYNQYGGLKRERGRREKEKRKKREN